MINIEYDKKNNFYIIKEKGIISVDEKNDFIKNLLKKNKGNKYLNVLHDMTEAEYIIDSDINNIIQKTSSIFDNINTNIKHAVIHSSPLNTAMSMIFQSSGLPANYEHKIFVLKENAIKWLLKN